jgi:hypothetical protein
VGFGFAVGAVGIWALTFMVVSLILTLEAAGGGIVLHIALVP